MAPGETFLLENAIKKLNLLPNVQKAHMAFGLQGSCRHMPAIIYFTEFRLNPTKMAKTRQQCDKAVTGDKNGISSFTQWIGVRVKG